MITKGKVFRRISVKARNKMSKQSGPKLYLPREKLQNCIWIFTIGDADDNPSVPHAHAKERGYRLMHGREIFIRQEQKGIRQ